MPILSTFGAGSSAGARPLASGGGGEAVKNGYYTDGYYVSGTQTTAPTASPQVALDANGFFYTYSTASVSVGTIAYGYHIHTAGHYYDFGVSGTGTTNPTLMQNTFFSTGTEGSAGYAITTIDSEGVGTTVEMNHSYGGGSIRHDNSTLASDDILYTGQYTNATANDLDYYTGTDGYVGYAHITTNGSGVATVSPVNHSHSSGYGSGFTWYNNSTLASGDTIYTGQYTDAIANNASFYTGTEGVSGYTHVNTNGSGVATVSLVDHSYTVTVNNTTYYRDTGSNTLYTGRYTNTLGTPTGLGTNMYYYSGASTPGNDPGSGPYTQISLSMMYSSCHTQTEATQVGYLVSTGLNIGGIVRKADGDIFDLNYFVYSGYRYTVNTTTGAITSIAVCDAYN